MSYTPIVDVLTLPLPLNRSLLVRLATCGDLLQSSQLVIWSAASWLKEFAEVPFVSFIAVIEDSVVVLDALSELKLVQREDRDGEGLLWDPVSVIASELFPPPAVLDLRQPVGS